MESEETSTLSLPRNTSESVWSSWTVKQSRGVASGMNADATHRATSCPVRFAADAAQTFFLTPCSLGLKLAFPGSNLLAKGALVKMEEKKLNVEISTYDDAVLDFPEAKHYSDYVAGRLVEIYKCEVSVTKGPMTKVFAYGFGDGEEDVVADVRSMVRVDLWNDFCSDGYKQFTSAEVG